MSKNKKRVKEAIKIVATLEKSLGLRLDGIARFLAENPPIKK